MRVLGNVFPGAFRLTIACFCSCVGTSSKFRTVGRGLVGRRGLVVEFIVELVEPNWLNPTGCTAPPHLWLMWDKVRTWFNGKNPQVRGRSSTSEKRCCSTKWKMEPSANEDMSNHEMALNRAAICVAQRVAVNGVTETYCGDAQQAEGRLLEMGAELILLKKKTERSKAAHAKLDSKLLLVEFEMAKIKESISASKVAVEDLTRCVVQAFDSKREVLNLAAAYYTRSEREGFTDEKVDKSIDIIEKITEDQYHTLLKARGLAEEALMTKRESLSLSEYENTAAKVKSSLKRKIAEVARHLGDEDCSLREQEKIRASIDEFNECSKCARGLEKMREIVRAKKMKADCKEDQSFECVVCYRPPSESCPIALLPCGCAKMCFVCLAKLEKKANYINLSCPTCRRHFHRNEAKALHFSGSSVSIC